MSAYLGEWIKYKRFVRKGSSFVLSKEYSHRRLLLGRSHKNCFKKRRIQIFNILVGFIVICMIRWEAKDFFRLVSFVFFKKMFKE